MSCRETDFLPPYPRAEGNLINTLDDSNPTRLLLRAIQTAGIDSTSEAAVLFKEEEEFYLGVFRSDDQVSQIFSIMSGDTSRGTIALNTTRSPPLGSKVQVCSSPYRLHASQN